MQLPAQNSNNHPRPLLVGIACCLFLKLMTACTTTDVTQPATTATPAADADAHWAQFLSWWPGDYDNSSQVMQWSDSEEGNDHLRLYIRQVDLPVFGEHVFYAEWQQYKNPEDIVRQRFYSFSREGDVLKLELHIFPNDTAFRERTGGAHRDPSRLAGVTPDDMVPLAGCDVYFQRQLNAFQGEMIRQRCRFPAPGTGVPIYSWSQMRLQADAFRYLDGWFRLDDSVYRQLAAEWYVFEKSRRSSGS